ncbi:hypothetical protein [Aquincola tertiaricarbonis]|uniref:hypothetical protein n=1 Tax=Aquincola tertiaricarbonis TaxID=391953 RepID=UPI0012ED9B44|nr:hypothetical protein [Aquincola tertiaricarbonis]
MLRMKVPCNGATVCDDGTALAPSAAPGRSVLASEAVAAAFRTAEQSRAGGGARWGDLWGGEERSAEVGARSALCELTRGRLFERQ